MSKDDEGTGCNASTAPELAKRIVQQSAGMAAAALGEGRKPSYPPLYEKAKQYLDAKEAADNLRRLKRPTAKAVAKEKAAREEFCKAYNARQGQARLFANSLLNWSVSKEELR